MKYALLFWLSPVWVMLLLAIGCIIGVLAGIWFASFLAIGVLDAFKRGWR